MNPELWQAHLFFAFAGFLLLPMSGRTVAVRAGGLALLAGLGFVHVGGLPLAAYPRSLFDDLALTTMAWLGYAVALRFRPGLRVQDRHSFQIILCFAFLALCLYPATLGLTYMDPYRLGFSPRILLVLMLLVTLVLWMQRNYFGVVLIAGATLGFVVDLKDSDNYWDYLIDPLLGLFCFSILILRGIGRIRAAGVALRRKPGTPQPNSSRS